MGVDLFAAGEGAKAPFVDLFAKSEEQGTGVDLFSPSGAPAPTYAGAAGAHLVQGVRAGVGGMMEAGGDVLNPEEESWSDVGMKVAGRIAGGGSALTMVGGALEELANGVRKKMTRAVISDDSAVAEVAGNLKGAGAELGAEARQIMREETPEDLNMLQEAGLSVISSTAQMTPWLVAARGLKVGPATLAPARHGFVQAGALGMFGAQSFGQTYSEARAAGADPEDAFKAGLLSGSAEIMGEKLGLDALLARGPNWFKSYLLKEIGGEEFTTIAQSLTEKGIYNPEKWSSASEILHDLGVTALAAAGGAGAIGAVDKGLSLVEVKRAEREVDAEAAAEMLRRELQLRMGVPEELRDGETPVPEPLSELSPEERAAAILQREQLANGLPVEPTPEGVNYGARLRMALSTGGMGQGRQSEEEVDALDEFGISPEVAARRAKDAEVGALPFDMRPITISPQDGNVLGLTLQQTGELPAGSIVAVGQDSRLFPVEVFTPVVETLQEFVQKYMPNARVILNLEQLPGQEFGSYASTVGPSGERTHVISVRELPGFQYQTGDAKTKMALIGALSHEFGHALKVENFFKGLSTLGDKGLVQIQDAIRAGNVTPKMLKAMEAVAPEEAALVRDWQKLRKDILDGKLTAKDFVDQWVGLRKLGDSVNPRRAVSNKSLYSWAESRAKESGKNLEGMTALEFVEMTYGSVDYALSFDEYMAEQFSRAAYTSGDLERSSIGKFFARTMEQLRDLFRMLKSYKGENGERIIAPGVTFQQWLDKQTALAAAMEKPSGKFTLSKKAKAAQKKILAENGLTPTGRPRKGGAQERKPGVAAPKDEQTLQIDEKAELTDMVYGLNSTGQITEKQLDRYLDKIGKGELIAVRESLQRLLGDTFMEDREYSSTVLSRLPNKERVKAETLRATIAQADVTAKERAMWQEFLDEHPDGFTVEEARAALEENILPLGFEFSGDHAYFGLAPVRASFEEAGTPVSRIWTNGDLQAPPHAQKHFRNDGYVMHSRLVDLPRGEGRVIFEMQSDLFQGDPEVTARVGAELAQIDDLRAEVNWLGDWVEYVRELTAAGDLEMVSYEVDAAKHALGEKYQNFVVTDLAQMDEALPDFQKIADEASAKLQKLMAMRTGALRMEEQLQGKVRDLQGTWWKRLIREEIAQAVEDNTGKVYFPTADTLAEIEGWPKTTEYEELRGQPFNWQGSDYVATGAAWLTPIRQPDTGETIEFVDVEVGQFLEIRMRPDQVPEDLLAGVQAMREGRGKESYGLAQGIYDRHKRDVTKYLKSKFKAEEVQLNGKGWLVVDLRDKTDVVMHWDRENPLQPPGPTWTIDEVAGLSIEEVRSPDVVAQAAGMWKRLGFESPFFKRWFGESRAVGLDGTPMRLFRGAGSRVEFLDPTTRGGQTGVSSARKAFWFSDNFANAQWYAEQATKGQYAPLVGEARRKGQTLRKQIAAAQDLLEEMDQNAAGRGVVEARKARLEKTLAGLYAEAGNTRPAQPVVQSYYLRLENPLEVDLGGQAYRDDEYSRWIDQALAEGRDGVILRNTFDPLGGTMYAVFEPEQAKMSTNVGTFDQSDELHWDLQSTVQNAARASVKGLRKYWTFEKLQAVNIWAKAQDMLVQLQQAAAAQPDDFNLQTFMRSGQKAMQLKNNLLEPAETLVKDLVTLSGVGARRAGELHRLLKEEWKSGQLQTSLVGYDSSGTVVWGQGVGTGLAEQAQVTRWAVEDTPQLRAWMKQQGVDVTTAEGKAVLELYLRTRDLFLFHFHELGKTLKRRVARTLTNAPEAAKMELVEINAMLGKLLTSPFVPQGNFGNYVLYVQEDQGPVQFGQRRYKTVFKRHFERKAEFDMAYKEAVQRAEKMTGVRVRSTVLEDGIGMPMQLPVSFLERLEATGLFDRGQLDTLADLMTMPKYERIADKFETISKQMPGGSEDFVRVLADFASRNANYIWKTHYRFELQQSISATKHLVRRLEVKGKLPAAERVARVQRLRRNIGLMENSLRYMIYPPNELQGVRAFVTLVYLAYNIKTALMNFSTALNTWAAITSEYGELAGNKVFVKGMKDTGEVLLYSFRRKQAEEAGKQVPGKQGMAGELVAVLDKAIQDGVVDQSYAYFLAAQSSSSPLLAATSGRMSHLGHSIAELGMMPFQATEKLNRIHSLFAFYQLERGAGTRPESAYNTAVAKTNQLQNSYDPMNRSELFRGKRAILTMFMSYVQFMGWIMTGGYERASRAQAKAQGRAIAPAWRGTTAKLWLLYLMLGGMMGLPFARNLMDVFQWIWRKLTGGNAEAEMRAFLEDMGMDSNWAMHGLLHDLGGFDLSGSFGLGRMLPGTDILTKTREMNSVEALGSMALMSSGPGGSFLKSVTEAVGYWKDGEWLEGAKAMPGAIGAVSKGTDAYLRQELRPTYGVTTKDGRRMTMDFERGEYRDLTTKELAGMLMGANPTILSENRALNFATSSEVLYWQTRRADLMDRHWAAKRSGDVELLKEVLAEVNRYNSTVPESALRVTGKNLRESEIRRRKAVEAGEKFGTAQKKYRGVAGDLREDWTWGGGGGE